MEITVKNYKRSKKWGWGYTFTPTGEDAYSIETPRSPDHTGTLNQIAEARDNDRTWQARGGAFYNTAHFHDGKRVLATWAFDIVQEPEGHHDMDSDEHYALCEYGWRWVNEFRPPDDENDVTIRVEGD